MVAPGKTANSLAKGARHLSKRLIASYVFDWVLILGTAAVGGAFNLIQGARHAFSLSDPNISFPQRKDTVSVAVLLVVSVIAPAVIMAVISLLFVPGPTAHRSTPKALIWRRKLWEWNTSWMGLGVSCAGAFMITEGLKDLAGKPRPYLLSVCDPDLSAAAIQRYRVGGLGQSLSSAVPILVTSGICRNIDSDAMHNAFASWPSGHSSFSWAGMLYLTFFLCAKFAIQLPFLAPASSSHKYISTFDEEDESEHVKSDSQIVPPRNEAAAPPVYLLIVAFVPIGVALFITLSRWSDYKHHGFDILSGSLIGIFTSWFGFRWYHLPIRQGAGWSWGARSRDRAFWLGIGIPTYVGNEGWDSAKIATQALPPNDIESGALVRSGGLHDTPENTLVNDDAGTGSSTTPAKRSEGTTPKDGSEGLEH